MIILTSSEADHVRGPTTNGAALAPRRMKAGTHALPEAVLDDPDHAIHHEYLTALPRREVSANEWPDEVIF
jgi:hypothetical protein